MNVNELLRLLVTIPADAEVVIRDGDGVGTFYREVGTVHFDASVETRGMAVIETTR